VTWAIDEKGYSERRTHFHKTGLRSYTLRGQLRFLGELFGSDLHDRVISREKEAASHGHGD